MNPFHSPVRFILFLVYVAMTGFFIWEWYKVLREINRIKNQPHLSATHPDRFVPSELYIHAGFIPLAIGFWIFLIYLHFFTK